MSEFVRKHLTTLFLLHIEQVKPHVYGFALQVGLAVVNGQLYAVGGFDGTTYLKTVELYERESAAWRHSGNMNYRRLGGGVGVAKLANDELSADADDAAVGVANYGANSKNATVSQ